MKTKYAGIALCVGIVLCTLIAWNSYSTSAPAGDADEMSVKAEIDNALNKGHNITYVETFLAEKKYEYSMDTDTQKIYAIKRDVRKGAFVTKSITVVFSIHNGEVTKYVTKVVLTGP